MQKRTFLSLLILLASIVVGVECYYYMNHILAASFSSIGNLSTTTVYLFLLQVFILCSIIILFAFFGMSADYQKTITAHGGLLKIPLIVGIILTVEGIIGLVLRNTVTSGSNQYILLSFCGHMYCLGTLAIVVYSFEDPNPFLFKKIPNFIVLAASFMMLIPALLLA